MPKHLNGSFSPDGKLLMIAYSEGTNYDFQVYGIGNLGGRTLPSFTPPLNTRKILMTSCYWTVEKQKAHFALAFEETPNWFEVWEWPNHRPLFYRNCTYPIVGLKLLMGSVLAVTCNEITLHSLDTRLDNYLRLPTTPNPKGIFDFGMMKMEADKPVVAFPFDNGVFLIQQFKITKPRPVNTHKANIEALAICSKRKVVAATCSNGTKIGIYKINSGENVHNLLRGAYEGQIFLTSSLVFDNEGNYLVADSSRGPFNLVHVFMFEADDFKSRRFSRTRKASPYKQFEIFPGMRGRRICLVSASKYLLIACANGFLYSYYLPSGRDGRDCIKVAIRAAASSITAGERPLRAILPAYAPDADVAASLPVAAGERAYEANVAACSLHHLERRARPASEFLPRTPDADFTVPTPPPQYSSPNFTARGRAREANVAARLLLGLHVEDDFSRSASDANSAVSSPPPPYSLIDFAAPVANVVAPSSIGAGGRAREANVIACSSHHLERRARIPVEADFSPSAPDAVVAAPLSVAAGGRARETNVAGCSLYYLERQSRTPVETNASQSSSDADDAAPLPVAGGERARETNVAAQLSHGSRRRTRSAVADDFVPSFQDAGDDASTMIAIVCPPPMFPALARRPRNDDARFPTSDSGSSSVVTPPFIGVHVPMAVPSSLRSQRRASSSDISDFSESARATAAKVLAAAIKARADAAKARADAERALAAAARDRVHAAAELEAAYEAYDADGSSSSSFFLPLRRYRVCDPVDFEETRDADAASCLFHSGNSSIAGIAPVAAPQFVSDLAAADLSSCNPAEPSSFDVSDFSESARNAVIRARENFVRARAAAAKAYNADVCCIQSPDLTTEVSNSGLAAYLRNFEILLNAVVAHKADPDDFPGSDTNVSQSSTPDSPARFVDMVDFSESARNADAAALLLLGLPERSHDPVTPSSLDLPAPVGKIPAFIEVASYLREAVRKIAIAESLNLPARTDDADIAASSSLNLEARAPDVDIADSSSINLAATAHDVNIAASSLLRLAARTRDAYIADSSSINLAERAHDVDIAASSLLELAARANDADISASRSLNLSVAARDADIAAPSSVDLAARAHDDDIAASWLPDLSAAARDGDGVLPSSVSPPAYSSTIGDGGPTEHPGSDNTSD